MISKCLLGKEEIESIYILFVSILQVVKYHLIFFDMHLLYIDLYHLNHIIVAYLD